MDFQYLNNVKSHCTYEFSELKLYTIVLSLLLVIKIR